MMQKAHHQYEPTPDELVKAQEHVLYEIRMLNAATDAYFDRSRSRKDARIGSAFTDSLLLHARNLYKFLTGKPKKKDDILAGHFVKKRDGTFWTSLSLPHVKSCMKDINKYRNHLTYSRIKGRRDWSRNEIRNEINKAFREFVALLPESEQEQWRF